MQNVFDEKGAIECRSILPQHLSYGSHLMLWKPKGPDALAISPLVTEIFKFKVPHYKSMEKMLPV